MKFTLSWLKEHLDTNASVEEIAETLTKIGLEVEEVFNPASKLDGFVTAKVETYERHPDTDTLIDIAKLSKTTVEFFNHTPAMAMISYSNFGSDSLAISINVSVSG